VTRTFEETMAAAPVHATLALAAATAVNPATDDQAWLDVAGAKLSGQSPNPGRATRQSRFRTRVNGFTDRTSALAVAVSRNPGRAALGRYGGAMWSPPDPYRPTSELYWLMPPWRQPGQLREALDAARGVGGPDDDDPIVLISPDLGRWREPAARAKWASRRVPAWVGTLVILTLAGVLSLVIYAALSGH
jgi:hypothetical protein